MVSQVSQDVYSIVLSTSEKKYLEKEGKVKWKYTNTVAVPNIITGLRPYRSATIPQKTDVNALPSINAEPSTWNQATKHKFT